MDELFHKYYTSFHQKNYKKIIKIIQDFYPKRDQNHIKKISSHNYTSIRKNKSNSFQKISNYSPIQNSEFSNQKNIFLYHYIYRQILIYELSTFLKTNIIYIPHISELYKYVKNAEKIIPLTHFYGNEHTNYFKINNTTMIKVINITDQEISDYDENPAFYKEVEIAKIAEKINVGPKIYNVDIFVDTTNSKAYGIIYMEYIDGINLEKYLEYSGNKEKVRNILESLFEKLYKNNITLISPHRRDIPINMIVVKSKSKSNAIKIVIIDYTFAQYITDYIYDRNYGRLNKLYEFSRTHIYESLYHSIKKLYQSK
jgi:hypothetical protein